MNRFFSAVFACILFVSGNPAQQISRSNGGLGTALPLVQIEHMAGDQYTGFTHSCLLVYSSGEYHREIRRQVRVNGQPSLNWHPPEVFEGGIDAGDLKQLGQIVESQSFRAIAGTVGNTNFWERRLITGPGRNGTIPRYDIDVFNVSVAHSDGSQVFEVVSPMNREQANSLNSFKSWIARVDARKEGRINNAAANGCSVKTLSQDRSSSWDDTSILSPRPLSTQSPDDPIDLKNSGHLGNVTVHAIINLDGTVTPVSVQRGLDPRLAQYAKAAVSHWKFAPGRLNGMPVASSIDLDVSFAKTKDQPH